MKGQIMITQSELKSILHYDQETGLFTWLINKAKRTKIGDIAGTEKRGYQSIKINYQTYYAHRLAWLYVYGELPKNMIDHINGNTSDNRIENLRDVTNIINQQNQKKARKDNESGFLGVNWHKASNKWAAQIQINKIKKHIGLFDNAEEARKAYLEAKRKYHVGCTI
jgi:hypothetical protein